MKSLIIHPAAAIEFGEAVERYDSQTEGVGQDFRQEIERSFKRLHACPQLYPLVRDTRCRKCLTLRFPYAIYFLDLQECIWIVAIVHGSRRPAYWTDRLSDL